LATNDQLSSNWASRVLGGKGHEFLVGVVGVLSGQAAVPHHRIAVGPHEPAGLADATPFVQVLQDRDGFLLGQVRAEQGRALALGGATATGAALQDPVLFLGATPAVDAEVVAAAAAVVLAVRVQATEACEVVHGRICSTSPGKESQPDTTSELTARNHDKASFCRTRPKYRIALNGVEKSAMLDLGNELLALRTSAYPKERDRLMKGQARRLYSPPGFGAMIDIDSFQEDPISVEPRDFVETSLSQGLNRFQAAIPPSRS
jgi:hypothetical protein